MQTRSQTKALLNKQIELKNLEFIFDFDESSRAWKANKRSIGNGSYVYVCQKPTITGKTCARKCLAGIDFCSVHKNKK
jgi:hypothetical protein